jgi:MFS family permease
MGAPHIDSNDSAGSRVNVAGMRGDRLRVVSTLGVTQTLAWASSYYLPAILAVPIARDFAIPNAWMFGAFTASLLVMGALGPVVGREIDRRGGRPVLSGSNVVIAAGLILLALAHSVPLLAVAWLILGIGMALGLYDAAFAALAGFYGDKARGPITGVTLMGGFASTVGWPVTAALDAAYGWRTACLVWAAVHVLLCLPLNLSLPRKHPHKQHAHESTELEVDDTRAARLNQKRSILLLAVMFSAAWFVTGAMATHLPRLLQQMGASAAAAVAASAMVGPAQVAARLVEFGLFRNLHPLISARIAVSLHPIGAACLALFGASAAALFSILHGAGNGMLTIARGTLPLALFGSTAYGLRQGLLGAPARLTQATSPFLFGLVLDVSAGMAIALSSALLLIALGCLLILKVPRTPANIDALQDSPILPK